MNIAIPNEDRLDHDRAVWRDGRPPETVDGSLPVSVQYGDGAIICTLVCQADWETAVRYRYGWPPQ